jgi:hypothetical protein
MSINNPEVIINGDPIAIVPNSFKYDEGIPVGEVRAAVIGATIIQDFSEDVETAFSTLSFTVYPGVDRINRFRAIANNRNNNVISMTAIETVSGVEKELRRTFKNASLVTKPEIMVAADGEITIEFKSDGAV